MITKVAKEERQDRLIHERVHDPYKTRRKVGEPAFCPECGAVFSHGRWQWAEARPENSQPELCQACQRIRDHYPAGVVTIAGAFAQGHKEEILNLVRHHETLEKRLHPLHRILDIQEQPAVLLIQTTDIHLPRRIGEALRRAYKGELEIRHEEETHFARVNWRRED